MILAFCLILPTDNLVAQSAFWQALDGPKGIQEIYALASNDSGLLLMRKEYKIYCSTDSGNSWSLCMNGLGTNTVTIDKFLQSPDGVFYIARPNENKLYRYNATENLWTAIRSTTGSNRRASGWGAGKWQLSNSDTYVFF